MYHERLVLKDKPNFERIWVKIKKALEYLEQRWKECMCGFAM